MSREVCRFESDNGPRALRCYNLQSAASTVGQLDDVEMAMRMLIVDGDRARRSRPEPADPSVIIQTKLTIDQKSQMLTEGEKQKELQFLLICMASCIAHSVKDSASAQYLLIYIET